MIARAHVFRLRRLAWVSAWTAIACNAPSSAGDEAGEATSGTGMHPSSSETGTTHDPSGPDDTATPPCHLIHDGHLMIDESTDLASLADLREVTGHLVIVRPEPATLDLHALDCLERVGGDLRIFYTPGFSDLSGLHRLSFVGDRLLLGANPDLRSLEGLDALRYVPLVQVGGNPALEHLHLRRLQAAGTLFLGQPCEAGTPPTVGDNPSLTTIDGLDDLIALGSLVVVGQTALDSLDGLHALAERGAHVSHMSFEFNEGLPLTSIEAAAMALGVSVNACGNEGQDPSRCVCPISQQRDPPVPTGGS